MIKSFADRGTSDIYHGKDTKIARKTLPADLVRIALRKLDMLQLAKTLEALRFPPGNQLETLKGDRKGQHSIRINEQYRVCFVWEGDQASGIEITDYH